jgi:hypothetical protein
MQSKNGTFVNDRQIHSETSLSAGDRVRIGNTILPWEQYLRPAKTIPKNNNAWYYIGSAAAAILLIVAVGTGIGNFSPGNGKNIEFAGEYPPSRLISVTDEYNSEECRTNAVPGQIIMFFEENILHSKAKKTIASAEGEIIAQIPGIHYYLVEVNRGNENLFITQMRNNSRISYISANAVEIACIAQTNVIDNYYKKGKLHGDGNHGDEVANRITECGITAIRQYNAGNPNEDGVFISSEIIKDLNNILSNAQEDESPVINMSFGTGFTDPNIKFWTDKNITQEVKNDYRNNYVNRLRELIQVAKNYENKDFVIIKAAGNEGIKQLDREILNEIDTKLTNDEMRILNRHFILVSAEDSRYKAYSNEVSAGSYNSLLTKVDISDMVKNNGENLHGTSFATPRAACFIASVANENKIKVTDVLGYVKEVTRSNPSHILVRDDLNTRIKEDIEFGNTNSETEQYPKTYPNRYDCNDCLQHKKTVKGEIEYIELKNLCDRDIRVEGYCLNAIASHGGDNTLNFEKIIRAHNTEYVEGFIENEYKITKIEYHEKNNDKGKTAITACLSPEQIARKMFKANADGNVETIKALSTKNFFDFEYPMDDNSIRENLLSVPYEKRQELINDADNMSISVIKTGENMVVARCINSRNNKQFDYYMKIVNGEWKIYDYAKGGIHISKSMRRKQ